MGSGFYSSGQTYKRTLKLGDGDAEETLEVELRPLTAGDRADLQDQLRIVVDDDDADGNVLQLRPGTSRVLTVAAAVTSWNLDIAPSVASIRALHPEVLDWLFAEVSWGEVPEEQSPEELAGDPLADSNGSSERTHGALAAATS